MNKVIVVIPAYNEADTIYRVVQDVISYGYDVIVVDDGSSDSTARLAAQSGAEVLRHIINCGYGAALETGNLWARRQGYETIVHFDADGQHEAADIAKLLAPLAQGEAEVVLGSRFLPPFNSPLGKGGKLGGIPLTRKLLIKLAIHFTWLFSGIKLTDAHNGLRAFSAVALEKIECRQRGMAYASEIVDQTAEAKLKYKEVPVMIKYTDYSKTKGESNIRKVLLGAKFLWGKVIK